MKFSDRTLGSVLGIKRYTEAEHAQEAFDSRADLALEELKTQLNVVLSKAIPEAYKRDDYSISLPIKWQESIDNTNEPNTIVVSRIVRKKLHDDISYLITPDLRVYTTGALLVPPYSGGEFHMYISLV